MILAVRAFGRMLFAIGMGKAGYVSKRDSQLLELTIVNSKKKQNLPAWKLTKKLRILIFLLNFFIKTLTILTVNNLDGELGVTIYANDRSRSSSSGDDEIKNKYFLVASHIDFMRGDSFKNGSRKAVGQVTVAPGWSPIGGRRIGPIPSEKNMLFVTIV